MSFNFMAAVTVCSDFGAPENKICYSFHFFPFYSLSSSIFIKRLFSSSSLSAIRVVLSAYLRLLIFPPASLTPTCASSSPAFRKMYRVNKQGDCIQPYVLLTQLGTSALFHVWFCFFLTYIKVSQETGKVVWYSHLFKNFSVWCDPHSQRL